MFLTEYLYNGDAPLVSSPVAWCWAAREVNNHIIGSAWKTGRWLSGTPDMHHHRHPWYYKPKSCRWWRMGTIGNIQLLEDPVYFSSLLMFFSYATKEGYRRDPLVGSHSFTCWGFYLNPRHQPMDLWTSNQP